MTTLPLNDDTKQFIIDHWAAIQPKDISAGWNVSAVEFDFDHDEALVTCNSPVPPSPRVVRVSMARIAAHAEQMDGHWETVEVGRSERDDSPPPVVEDEGTDTGDDTPEPPAKPKRSSKK